MLPLLFPLFFLVVSGLVEAQPRLLWETPGFDSPESVLHDAQRGVLYVSNVNGAPTSRDGNGYISLLRVDGSVIERRWAEGLDAPKGLARVGRRLYVTDIDRVVEIDIETGRALAILAAPGARFLNDAVATPDGTLYFSDMQTASIWRLHEGRMERWLASDNHTLCAPNGLAVEGRSLVVACWSWALDEFDPELPGHLKRVDLKSRAISDLGAARQIGRLDGIEPDGAGGWFVTDWVAGILFRVDRQEARPLLHLETGSADLGTSTDRRTLFIPLMQAGTVRAYSLNGVPR